MVREKVRLFIQDDRHEQVKVQVQKMRVSLDSQKQRGASLSSLAHKPLIHVAHFQKQLNREFRYLIVLADESWLDGIQAGLSVFWVGLDKLPQLFVVLVQQRVEKLNPFE